MLRIGIVGLPNVGKSTLFNALTKKGVPAENYPFCTIDPSVGIVSVPDERLEKLAKFSNSKKIINATIEFTDIAGLVEGASKGQGLGNKFLANIREVDAICHVIRLFGVNDKVGNTINHVYGSADPVRDKDIIEMELTLSDLATVENKIAKLSKDVKSGNKEAVKFNNLLTQKIKPILEAGKSIRNNADLDEDEEEMLKTLHLITNKPVLYVFNYNSSADNFMDTNPDQFKQLIEDIKSNGDEYVIVDIGLEDNYSEDNSDLYNTDYNAGLNKLIQTSYRLLDRISFFTSGETETRAWSIKKGTDIKNAGAAIHSDFRDKFIRAEVINYEELLKFSSYNDAKNNGKVMIVGKEYIVQDGDVVLFRI